MVLDSCLDPALIFLTVEENFWVVARKAATVEPNLGRLKSYDLVGGLTVAEVTPVHALFFTAKVDSWLILARFLISISPLWQYENQNKEKIK